VYTYDHIRASRQNGTLRRGPTRASGARRPRGQAALNDQALPCGLLRKSATQRFAEDAQNCVGEFCASSANPEEFDHAVGQAF
jgi:hypothetical protein